MPIPSNHYRVVVVGHDASPEIFQFGWFVSGAAPSSAAAANTIAAEWAGWIQANMSGIKALIATDGGIDKVKIYSYVTGGTRADYVGEAPITGGIGTGPTTAPLQLSLVVTLRTGLAGRRHRGRVYLPLNGVSSFPSHLLPVANCTAALNNLQAIFNLQNAAHGPGAVVAVVSAVASTSNKVTELAADQKPDIQRRRANRFAGGTTSTVTVT